jgi:hypothetical protein
MRREFGHGDGARHGETIFEQWPIKRFSVEGNKHRPLGDALRQFLQQRMLFGKVAHKELLDLQAAGIPPRQANQKSVSAGASREAGGFRVEEKPPFRVFKRGTGLAGKRFVASTGK